MEQTENSTPGAADDDDDDEYVPDRAEAQYLAGVLLEVSPRQRLRGQVGAAIREVQEIDGGLATWDQLPPAEKRPIVNRLWELKETLGFGRFDWWSKCSRRPGANSRAIDRSGRRIIDHALDDDMIREALSLTPSAGSLGTALRMVVERRMKDTDLRRAAIPSVVQRLRRKIQRQSLQRT